MSEISLKHCPFCGGKATLHDESGCGFGWMVYCADNECSVAAETMRYEEPQHAIEAWNTRADDNSFAYGNDAAYWHDEYEKLLRAVDVIREANERTCHDVYPDATYCFTCSECGHIRRFIQGWNNVTHSSQDEFNFCPNCGAKVVEA